MKCKNCDKGYIHVLKIPVTEFMFIEAMNRKPKNLEEFKEFVHYVKQGIVAQLDWDMLYSCAGENIEQGE